MNITDGTYFYEDNLKFHMSIPPYDIPIFGDFMGELRLVPHIPHIEQAIPLHDLPDFFLKEEVLACTFRGEENINIVRRLNSLGFNFVGTYSIVICAYSDFKEIPNSSDLEVVVATPDDYDSMKAIKSQVFDYSTHQLDPSLDADTTSYRNVMRLSSYFDNPNHCAYVGKAENKVVGYLQFVIDNQTRFAFCANGAIDPEYQGLCVGAKIYSDGFRNVFKQDIKLIESGYCNQNIPARKLHQACGFKVKKHEIHLRHKTW